MLAPVEDAEEERQDEKKELHIIEGGHWSPECTVLGAVKTCHPAAYRCAAALCRGALSTC